MICLFDAQDLSHRHFSPVHFVLVVLAPASSNPRNFRLTGAPMKGMAGAVTDSKLLYDNEHDDVDDHEDFMVHSLSPLFTGAYTRLWQSLSV